MDATSLHWASNRGVVRGYHTTYFSTACPLDSQHVQGVRASRVRVIPWGECLQIWAAASHMQVSSLCLFAFVCLYPGFGLDEWPLVLCSSNYNWISGTYSQIIDLMIMSLPLPLPGSRIYRTDPRAIHGCFTGCVQESRAIFSQGDTRHTIFGLVLCFESHYEFYAFRCATSAHTSYYALSSNVSMVNTTDHHGCCDR